MKPTNQQAAPKPVIDTELARKVLDRDIINLVNKAKNGRPLTPEQRRLIALYAGVLDKGEMLEALSAACEMSCTRCARIISKLMANITNA